MGAMHPYVVHLNCTHPIHPFVGRRNAKNHYAANETEEKQSVTPSPEPSPLIYSCPRVLISKFDQTCPERLTLFLQYDTSATSSTLATLSIPSHCLAFRRIFLIDNVLRSDRHVHNVCCFGVELAFCMTMVSHDSVKSNTAYAIIFNRWNIPFKAVLSSNNRPK